MIKTGKVFIFWVAVILGFSASTAAATLSCDQYLRYPLAGHPVELVDLHPSDKYYSLLAEIKKTKLILLEPGICRNPDLDGWYFGSVFVIKSFSASFHYGQIIDIRAGRFK